MLALSHVHNFQKSGTPKQQIVALHVAKPPASVAEKRNSPGTSRPNPLKHKRKLESIDFGPWFANHAMRLEKGDYHYNSISIYRYSPTNERSVK
jgi:hypothetical protein